MSDHTKIEWTDATWNPITGCTVVSPGCTNCYAMGLAGTRLKHHPSRAGLTDDSRAGPVWNGEVRFNEQWLDQPLRWRKPRNIFVCAHGDLFHPAVPDDWIDRVFAVMALAPHHRFQVLTKRADRMREYLTDRETHVRIDRLLRATAPDTTWNGNIYQASRCLEDGKPLPNVWLGVSVEDQKRADERIPDLLATPAAVRWISAEPLLGPVRLDDLIVDDGKPGEWHVNALDAEGGDPADDPDFGCNTLDWVVVGGESGKGARPMHPDWARSLRDQCQAAGVAYFFKQWGAWSPGYAEHGNDLDYGLICNVAQHDWPEGHCSFSVGKARAGRLLDGREWNEVLG